MHERIATVLANLFSPPLVDTVERGEVGAGQDIARELGVTMTEHSKCGAHFDVVCRPDQVEPVARVMDNEGFFLETITGVDWIEQQQLEVIYDYNRFDEPCRVVARVKVPRSEPVLPSITAIYSAADWHERETFDFYGVQFQGHPNLIRILLPEDADFYPLLKDFTP